jgi:hypothetical protein
MRHRPQASDLRFGCTRKRLRRTSSEPRSSVRALAAEAGSISGADVPPPVVALRPPLKPTLPKSLTSLPRLPLPEQLLEIVNVPKERESGSILSETFTHLHRMLFVVLWPWTRILRRMGFSPWLSLLIVIPLLNFIFFYYLAFGRWPRDDGAAAAPK